LIGSDVVLIPTTVAGKPQRSMQNPLNSWRQGIVQHPVGRVFARMSFVHPQDDA
jgi:hypothetical protein